MSEDQTAEKWVEVHRVPTLAEGEIVEAILESAGISSKIEYDATSRVILGPGSMNPWSTAKIWVRESQAEEARRILDEALRAEPCPECDDDEC